jgi:hypothetical protein
MKYFGDGIKTKGTRKEFEEALYCVILRCLSQWAEGLSLDSYINHSDEQ